jgi:hypothetical protein
MPVPIPNLNQLQINPPKPATSMLQAMEFKDQQRRTGIAEDRNAIMREGQTLQKDQLEFNKAKSMFASSRDYVGGMSRNEFSEYKDWLSKIPVFGELAGLLPDQQEIFEMSEDEFLQMKEKISIGTDNLVAMEKIQLEATIKQINTLKLEDEKQKNRIELEKEKAKHKTEKAPTENELTIRAANGDKEAEYLLTKITEQSGKKARAAGKGKLQSLLDAMGGGDAVAKAVVEGRQDWGKIKNTFGSPLIEMIRLKVEQLDPNFDFIVPTAVFKALGSSLTGQEKQRGMMQSFVQNINSQIDRVDEMIDDSNRWGIRILDVPRREIAKRVVGSGHEVAIEAYLMEISNEINKLSQGSQASIAQLGEESQKRWNAVHDPALSLNEVKIILDETRRMADMRMKSVERTIEITKSRMKSVLNPERGAYVDINMPKIGESKFEILSVED